MTTNVLRSSTLNKVSKNVNIVLGSVAMFAFSIIMFSCKKSNSTVAPNPNLRTKTIILTPTPGNMQSGTATFQENADHSFNVKVDLSNTIKDTVMSIDIHNGSFNAMSSQAIELNGLKGTGGDASTTTSNIKTVHTPSNGNMAITYDSIIVYKGVINVSYSFNQDDRHIAYGNIAP